MSKTVLFITSAVMGRGDDELGKLLTKNFLITLSEQEERPNHILLVNSGVTLITDESPALETMEVLAEKGVEILACGTCLDYFKLKDKVRVGSVTNMYTIRDHLLNSEKVITL